MRAGILRGGFLFVFGACANFGTPIERISPEILDVQVKMKPSIQGTAIYVSVGNFDSVGYFDGEGRFDAISGMPRLHVLVPGHDDPIVLDAEIPVESSTLRFLMSRELISTVGEGTKFVSLVLQGDSWKSDEYEFELNIALEMPLQLLEAPHGEVYRNEQALVHAQGLLEKGEGYVVAHFRGEFRSREGTQIPVDAVLPLQLVEEGNRSRGIVELSTAIGGSMPGVFSGTFELESNLVSGQTYTSSTQTELSFQPPIIFGVSPPEVTLEQKLSIRGAGFLGKDGGTTLVRIEGILTGEGGVTTRIGPVDELLEFVSGTELVMTISAEDVHGVLLSRFFGVREGRFEGTLMPITLNKGIEVQGESTPVTIALAPVRQVVWVHFVPGFYESLSRFGLVAATGKIEQLVAERIRGIYRPWNLDVRLTKPTDYSAQGYAVLEVGGPDPNGRGLLGLDATPGKDIGNLRLFDTMGGQFAETLADGKAGYGGVFVENFFDFSTHPPRDLPWLNSRFGFPPDPLFDEIFDSVRTQPATLAELRGEGERAAVVERALTALASMIGETSSHEIGHSLGLANPRISGGAWHNYTNGQGCLMDNGGARPVGERAAQPGFAPTRICGVAATYLDGILHR